MSLGSGFLENLPHFTFTPTEHQVECVRVASGRNLTYVTTQPNEKSFLVLMLVREVANLVRGRFGKVALLVYKTEQVSLWSSFLTRMTDLKVSGLCDSDDLDTGQIVESTGVLVTTHNTFNTLLTRKYTDLDNFCLVIVDNIQASFPNDNTFLSLYLRMARNQAPRLVSIIPNILTSNSDTGLNSLPNQLAKLQTIIPANVECACEVATQLRYLARPRESVLLYPSLIPNQCLLEGKIRTILGTLKSWILDQNYSLYDTYGEEFGDLIADIPDPVLAPLQLIQDFDNILHDLGVWCADRAALILMIKIDKLKTREKYERHFLLLSIVFTTMVNIRKLCDDMYGELEDLERLQLYSRPKLAKLVQLLGSYSPQEKGKIQEITDEQPVVSQQVVTGGRRRGMGRRQQQPESPDTLCALVVVSSTFSAKIIYHYLKDFSNNKPELSFLSPQYAVEDPVPSDPRDAENERKKQEEALRRFRMRECNILVSSSVLEEGIDFVKCNLVVVFDHPSTFHRYIYSKVKCKSVGGSLVHLSSDQNIIMSDLKRFHKLERCLVSNCTDKAADPTEDTEADNIGCALPGFPTDVVPAPLTLNNSILVLNRYCAKLPSDTFTRLTPAWTVEPVTDGFYCAFFLPINSPLKSLVVGKVMPSPALARRSAAFTACVQLNNIKELDKNMMPMGKESVLPPVVQVEWTPEDAVRPGTTKRRQYYYKRVADCLTRETAKDLVEKDVPIKETAKGDVTIRENDEEGYVKKEDVPTDKNYCLTEKSTAENINDNLAAMEILENKVTAMDILENKVNDKEILENEVTTTHSLEKKETAVKILENDVIAVKDESSEKRDKNTDEDKTTDFYSKFYEPTEDPVLAARYSSLHLPDNMVYSLYCLRMCLTCPIPEEQNTRGRKIHDPQLSDQLFGLLLPQEMPAVPSFPIYTRSGEVLVTIQLVQSNLTFSSHQLSQLANFHMFSFSSVLRLEKYPMVFSTLGSHNSVVVVPMRATNPVPTIDWEFLDTISSLATRRLRSLPDGERSGFKFIPDDYVDAVIMPWYRNQDQPQYFYVAEICSHLSPASDFPGQGFETFSLYYSTKYGINIQSDEQPLLDVDHTSARLNFLTPRYVNRKGIALPTSSEETKRNKRENLDQKQILVPELCAIHPFPASLWRQTVSLPCILYRLNGLLIGNQIRRDVATEMRLGMVIVPDNFIWPALNFGWTLADVVKNSKVDVGDSPEKKKGGGEGKESNAMDDMGEFGEWTDASWTEGDDMDRVTDKLINKLAEEERLARKKKLEIGTWSNEMASSKDQKVPGLDGKGLDWGKDDDDDEDLDMAGIELPDNLTFISTKGVGGVDIPAEGKKDWGTGIQAKNFRVGSPTCFTDRGEGVGGPMDGLINDLDGFSCSDSEYSWADDDASDTEIEREGGARIEFHGENVAEAIEAEDESQAREERVARDRDQEANMVASIDWDPSSILEVPADNFETEEEYPDINVDIISETSIVVVSKPSDIISAAQPSNLGVSDCVPKCPLELGLVDHETVFRHLFLAPDLDLVQTGQQEDWGVIPWPGIDPDTQFSFDDQPGLMDHPGPSPSLILQSLTMSNSNDAINLERLETIGDSFLKYAITSYLFCQHPQIHEGKLSHLRSKQVSNLNLYQLGRSRGLGEAMIATKFEPHDNWLPPCYHVPRELEQALIESGVPASHWNMADLPSVESMSSDQICQLLRERAEALAGDIGSDQDIQDMPSFIPYNLLTQHSIPDKSIADCVEALIGAYLIACGPRGALLLMTWLGLTVLPKNDSGGQPGHLEPPPSPLLRTPRITQPERHLLYLLDGYQKFEHMVGYVWRDKSYLLQAFSHASYYTNRLTDCYQRLEFLGDAVLDYLITRHLYQDPRLHSPGALTDLRSALVNNTIFACLAVRHQFHKFFKHLSPGLQKVCDRFVRIQAESGWKVSEECYLIEEEETEEAEDIEVPKALGDIFESVAGSIFLDSGLSLDAVWKVYYRMMKDEIDQFSSHVPKSPIRELLELEPETAKFGKPEKLADGRRVRVSVEVFGKGVFKGIGRNYRIAKCTAAKCALKSLKKMDQKKKNSGHAR